MQEKWNRIGSGKLCLLVGITIRLGFDRLSQLFITNFPDFQIGWAFLLSQGLPKHIGINGERRQDENKTEHYPP